MERIKQIIKEELNNIKNIDDKINFINMIKKELYDNSPVNQPVGNVIWIDIDKVEPNDYNPNSVASIEMNLLYKSILHDGYTQPVVTIYDKIKDKYIIVDGFHRYYVCKTQNDIRERNHNKLPIVVINKDINDRMSSTVRHNRARGEHSVNGMSNMVFKMLENGWSDSEICDNLGMEAEEILKLKHITGFSKLFENIEYKRSWEHLNQKRTMKKYKGDSINE